MRPTIPYLEQKFEEFNQQIFAGELPKLPIELTDAKTFIGKCVYRRRRKWYGKVVRYDFRLRFNTRIDLPEQEMEDTIIHEMIHYYIGYKQLNDTSAHGPLFRKMMSEINEKYGRYISVSHRSSAAQMEQAIDKKARLRFVAVITFSDGQKGLKVLPRVLLSILRYYKALDNARDVASVELFMSRNPFFNRFPCSGALRVHYLENKEIEEQLKDAERIVCDGFSLRKADR